MLVLSPLLQWRRRPCHAGVVLLPVVAFVAKNSVVHTVKAKWPMARWRRCRSPFALGTLSSTGRPCHWGWVALRPAPFLEVGHLFSFNAIVTETCLGRCLGLAIWESRGAARASRGSCKHLLVGLAAQNVIGRAFCAGCRPIPDCSSPSSCPEGRSCRLLVVELVVHADARGKKSSPLKPSSLMVSKETPCPLLVGTLVDLVSGWPLPA
jgi:hypothetical protein